MTKEFLKIKLFKIKAEQIDFKDEEFMSAKEKAKIYKNFISFLNNHFKESCFTKNLYNHLHLHCGFIAHYNIKGFYAEYFNTPAKFQKIAFDYNSTPTEYGVYINEKYLGEENIDSKIAFYKIYEELNSGDRFEGLSGFYNTIKDASSREYEDLNTAILEAFNEYKSLFIELIREAIKKANEYEKSLIIVEEKQKETYINEVSPNKTLEGYKMNQTSLFDFL
ncbi:hypothetical protein [Aliarcobacter skirrowii]|uniref:hypothetical protein n=1 Tax=Aliarcobacter skirrowii TaxID=28200 RepID=UPI0029B20055|nr:hypothetical protein [Aliarcobacter skirrowii]MDX4028334.1 hypothetical protein [Aliarcobacter skirrowii]